MSIQKVIITTRVILEREGLYFYLEQVDPRGGGFTFPGGKVEKEEFAKEALVREVFEEIGVTVKKKALVLAHVVYKKLKNSTEIIFFFTTSKWKGEPQIREPLKFKNFIWLPSTTFPAKTPRILKYALVKMGQGKLYSQYPKATKTKVPSRSK